MQRTQQSAFDYRLMEARVLLFQARELIMEFDQHEGAEGWSKGMPPMMERFLRDSQAWLTQSTPGPWSPSSENPSIQNEAARLAAIERLPFNCRERQRLTGQAYPKSGCLACSLGGLVGCPKKEPGVKYEH